MTRFVFILALIFTAPWDAVETVEVTDHGRVELTSFICQDVTRSSIISRVCYDSERHRMLVQRHAAYQQFCGLPPDTVAAFLSAPSIGRFFRTEIQGGDASERYACPPQSELRTGLR